MKLNRYLLFLYSIYTVLSFNTELYAQKHKKTVESTKDPHLYRLNENLGSSSDKKESGVNKGGVYHLGEGITLRIKDRTFSTPERDSLIISYLTSRLLQFISPDQVATIFIVSSQDNDNGLLIGSYDIPTFKTGGTQGVKNSILLDLSLDLMNIGDRHNGNLGTASILGEVIALAVDIDVIADNPKSVWLFNISRNRKFFLEHEKEYRESLLLISKISDKKIRDVFSLAVSEIEKALFVSNLKLHYNVDFILSKTLERKHQMEWASQHFDSMSSYYHTEDEHNSGQLSEINIEAIMTSFDRNDDKYGFFLLAALKEEKFAFVSDLIQKHGAKDPFGFVLKAAIKKKNLLIIKLLLEHSDKNAKSEALDEAAWISNLDIIKLLLEHGAKSLDGKALEAAVENDRLDLLKLLLEHDSRDPNGIALKLAVEKNKVVMTKLLLEHGAKDANGLSLIIAAKNDNLVLLKLLLEHGIKDREGFALAEASQNSEMFKLLLAYGAKDLHGLSLMKAVDKNNLERARVLLKHGAKDPKGLALEQAVWDSNEEMIELFRKYQRK